MTSQKWFSRSNLHLAVSPFFYFDFNLFQPNVAFHIETSYLISTPNQMTGFYMTMQHSAEMGLTDFKHYF